MKKSSFARKIKKSSPNNDDGLTLIECLVAIAIIALTSASIAPIVVLSVATRVQNQRSEQALQVAQGEIDRVRLLVERNPVYDGNTLGLFEAPSAPLGTEISVVGAPDSSVDQATWAAAGYSPASELVARQVDTDKDGKVDFLVQSFRGEAAMDGTMPAAFSMGVRVYDANSVGLTPTGLLTDAAGLGFTSGDGERGRRPLAVLYTQVINSDDGRSICEYLEFLEATVPASMSCN